MSDDVDDLLLSPYPDATLQVPARLDGERLDRAAAVLYKEAFPSLVVSRALVQEWLRLGLVQANGVRGKGSQKVAKGDVLVFTPPEPPPSELVPDPTVPFDVLYEDADLIVVHKPAGVVVHPAPGHPNRTLVNGLLARFDLERRHDPRDRIAHLRPGIVHRLDMGTSGVMVVAKTNACREQLKALFSRHDIERSYVALTVGATKEGTITTLFGRHPRDRMRMTTRVREGKLATTHVRVEQRFAHATLVECTLETGRTHQIRVHMAEVARTPVLGDHVYGQKPHHAGLAAIAESLGHQALHAAVLGFVHPTTGLKLKYEAPWPQDFRNAVDAISKLT